MSGSTKFPAGDITPTRSASPSKASPMQEFSLITDSIRSLRFSIFEGSG